MLYEDKKIDEIIRAAFDEHGIANYFDSEGVFRIVTKKALQEGFDYGYKIGHDAGFKEGWVECKRYSI